MAAHLTNRINHGNFRWGNVALITCAEQGADQGIASALAKEGAKIAAIGRTEAKLLDTCGQIAAFADPAIPIVADVHDAVAIIRSIVTNAGKLRPTDVTTAAYNPARAHGLLDWKPRIPWDETLIDVLNDWRGRVG